MKGLFTELFSLSVYRDTLGIAPELRTQLANSILSDASPSIKRSAAIDADEEAWLGDTAGYEFLFKDPAFAPLFDKIGVAVRSYLVGLGLDHEKLQMYFQRSWATISNEGQRIFEHAHLQSHISVAYYIQKPSDGGGIYFSVADHPNELAPGLFTLAKASAGVLKSPSDRNLNRKYLDPAEDEILIFPSKTLHSTAPNMTETPRISISADILLTLKDSGGHETLMPSAKHWHSF